MVRFNQCRYEKIHWDFCKIVFRRIVEPLSQNAEKRVNWGGSTTGTGLPSKTLEFPVSLLHPFQDLAVPAYKLLVRHRLVNVPVSYMCLERGRVYRPVWRRPAFRFEVLHFVRRQGNANLRVEIIRYADHQFVCECTMSFLELGFIVL